MRLQAFPMQTTIKYEMCQTKDLCNKRYRFSRTIGSNITEGHCGYLINQSELSLHFVTVFLFKST